MLSKIGKQKEQRDLDNEEKNSIKNLVNMSKDKNGTKLTKYEEMENDAKEYDKKEKEDSIVKKQIQLQINELKNDPSIVNEYESAWRSEARKRGLKLNIPVVCSKEEPINKDRVIASSIFVPSTAGLMLAYYIIEKVISH